VLWEVGGGCSRLPSPCPPCLSSLILIPLLQQSRLIKFSTGVFWVGERKAPKGWFATHGALLARWVGYC
jgi:hypothetical protein